MKKAIALTALGYVVTVALLLSFLYWFLRNEGFSEETFLAGSGLVLLLSAGWGYVIASQLVAPHKKREAHLLHLTKDIIHELNLPLATIEANLAMLSKSAEDARAQKRLMRIDGATKRLSRLYEELLYTIRKEMQEIPRETFSLPRLVRERTEILEEQRRNPVIVEVEMYRILADRIGFEQMLDNLILNAMKYSPKTEPVRICCKNGILEISDRGIGMDEAQLLRVFERYYQADTSSKGEGIGLALVKAYCDREDIGIEIYSKKGEGTKVVLDLKRVIVDEEERENR